MKFNVLKILSLLVFSNIFSQPNFSDESQLSGISANASFVIDLDQDGDTDILFSSYETNKLWWLEKNEADNLHHSGYLEHDLHQESQIGDPLDRISSIFSIDFDSDGDLDIIASGFQNDMVGVYLNDGTEGFEFIEIGNPNGPLFVSVVDLDNNGFLDIICASLYDNTVQWYKTESVDDNGQMSYSHEVISNNAVGPASLSVEDIDNDGDLDVVSAGCYDSNNKVAIYFNDGNENFSELVINADNGAAYADVSVADIFQGGNLEIVAASSDNKRVTLFYDSGDLSYSNSTVLIDTYNVNYSQIFDMDSDNDPDIVFSGYDASLSQTVFGILKNDGNGSFNEEIIGSFDQGASIRGSKVADLDLDQDLDILFCSSLQNYEGVYCLENTSLNDTPLELNVPGSFSTIQEAINASSDGDIVIVAAGTYVENINFSGKNIIVQGENSETTIIDGNQNGSVVTFNSGETSSALLTGFTVQNGANNSGAGIYCYNASSPSITHCIISGNVGIEGAGIKCDDSSSPNITDCIISGNTASGNGGGICTPNSSPIITNCMITGNTANDGGGIFFYLSNATITNSTISNNVALADGGENGGGGIHCNSASPIITDCIISENATNYGGGGIYCTYSSSPTITNCTITGNTASVHGGGIDCYNSSSPFIINSTISNNTASWGGGFWILSTPTIKNCTIVGNTATNGGGAIESYSSSSYPIITNCTITGNTAPDGGIRSSDAFSTITNCILWNNSPVEIYVASGNNPNITYSDIKDFEDIGIEEGNGNIDADPMWVDPPNGNFTLQPSSPCINAGDPNFPLDPDGSVSDMGAYPYHMEGGPLVIDSFDEGLSGDYGYMMNENANPSISYLNTTASDFENAQCVKIDYSVHNNESWGGFVHAQRNAPDEFWDWSDYNTISFNYFNSIPPDQTDRVEFRLILDDIDDSGFYSFHYILDDVSNQWEKVEIPLINNGSWNGNGFNYTGWIGTEGDGIMDLSQIRNYKLEFTINSNGESGDYQSGTIYLDELQLENTIPRYPVTFQFDARSLNVHPAGIHIAGDFTYEQDNPDTPGWDDWGVLEDLGNGFWSITLDLVQGDYQYKFINGNTWQDQHDQIYEELSCTFNDGSGYYNRLVSVNADIVLAPVCLNSCEPCDLQFFTIENVSVVHGDTALVEVSMNFSNPSFSSIDLSFSGFQDELVFNDIVTEGYMFGDAQWITVVNNTETLLITASAGATSITDNGVLFALELVVPETLSTQIVPVVIEDFSGNEDLDEAIFIDGGVEVVWEPLAGFESNTTNGYLPLTINFTDTSEIGTYPIVDWQWNFGDGTLVSGSEAEHTYLEEGNYTVTLIVTDEFGLSDTLEMVDFITAMFPLYPAAGFAVSTSSGDYPLDIVFTDTSNMGTYPIIDWSWDFGNDSTGVGSEVSATYERPGEFDITLMVTDEYGLSDTLILVDFIQVDTTYGDLDWNTNVQSFDASFILKHLAEMIELDDLQLQVADVTQDETVSTMDATVILQHVVGLVEDLPFSPDESYSATGDLTMSDQGAEPGMQIEIPVSISNGSNIYGFTGNLIYDPTVLSIDTVLFSDYLDGYLFELNEINPGEIRIVSAGGTPDGETGIFATLIITIGDNFAEATGISITDLRWNEGSINETPIEMTISFGLGVDVASIPDVFALHQNYPNPFNPTTEIKYDLPEDALVSITIYDVMGRNIRTLVNINQTAGYHSIRWDAKNNIGEGVAAGMYIYMIKAGEFQSSKKMVLLK